MDEIRAASTREARGTIVKQVIEETAARLAYNTNTAVRSSENTYFFEKIHNIPRYWTYAENFESFICQIDRNLLFAQDVKKICKCVNKLDHCPRDGCKACKHHPFSLLRNLGMLGLMVLTEDQIETLKQSFLKSSEITYFHDRDSIHLNDHTMYLIHPALTKSIESLKSGDKIMHFRGFLIGREIEVKKSQVRAIFYDLENMPKEEFDLKYYQAFRNK